MVPEVLTACKCIAVLSLIANVVVVPMAMCSVFDMVDVEVQALAECGTVLMGEQLALLKICDVSCGSSDDPIVHFCSALTHIQKHTSHVIGTVA